uniref:cysteine desulfurase n=1 Tax=viral metagenome TaxID=1070528 RepID=A0A6C0ACQ9_9ZZZZ
MTFYLYSDKPVSKPERRDMYYFDNNSTTLIEDSSVMREMTNWISCANPSNILHKLGRDAREKIEECRHFIAFDMKVGPSEVYFTSGATESNNMVILGLVRQYLAKKKKFTIITSSFEHPSVFEVFKHLESEEYLDVVFVNPCSNNNSQNCGRILPEDIETAIQNAKSPVKLVSIMYANNETGAINDVEQIGKICRNNKIFLHCDATQAMGKYIIHPKKLNIHAMTFSAHKFHGPKGVGCLFLNKKMRCQPEICYGGEQESHKRPGTENVANIAGMTQALRLAHLNREEKNKTLIDKRTYIENKLSKYLQFRVLGCKEFRLPNTILCLIDDLGKCNKILVKELDKKNICVSIGSACQTKKDMSHVLKTMDISQEQAKKIIRISLSDYTTDSEVRYLVQNLIKIVKKLSKKENKLKV